MKFHVTEILGKLHLAKRADAARWYRQQLPRMPVWAAPLQWLREGSRYFAPAVGLGTVVLVMIMAGIAAWGVSRSSRSAVAPEIIRTPDHLVMAEWMNGGQWILALDFEERRYKVVDRSFREVFVLPRELWDVRGSRTGSRVIAVDSGGTTLLGAWDAATGERISTGGSLISNSEFDTAAWDEWTYVSGEGSSGYRSRSGAVILSPPAVTQNYCGVSIAPSGRFAVARVTCNGPCRLVDMANNSVIKEWNLEPWDQAPDDNCDVVRWSPDERQILLSNGVT